MQSTASGVTKRHEGTTHRLPWQTPNQSHLHIGVLYNTAAGHNQCGCLGLLELLLLARLLACPLCLLVFLLAVQLRSSPLLPALLQARLFLSIELPVCMTTKHSLQ